LQLFEKVRAGYSSFSWTINSKTEVKIGLRYEYTNTNLGSKNQPNVVDRQYGSWFPTVYVSRKFDENHVINFSYNQRINRPGFTQLAPYLIYFDPTTVNGGNPALQPSFVTSYRGTYSFNGWSLTADYSVTDASIRDFPFIDVKNNRQFNKPENQGTDKMFFLDLSFHYSFTKWWETQNDFYIGHQLSNFIFADKPIEAVTKAAGFNCTQSITLPHKFSIDISANYLTPSYWGIYKYNGNGNLSFGFNKNFGEKWGSLTFNINDIFQSSNWLGTAKDPSVNLNVFNAFKDAERTFMITWSNKFGNKKLKDSRQRARGSDEEMRRL
jgi:Outer membrane protein beta-barrel family